MNIKPNQQPLFTSARMGKLELRNRIIMAPLTRMRAGSIDHVPTALQAEYYAQRASAGLIVAEATAISPDGFGYADTPGLWSADQMRGWRLVTDAVHAAGGGKMLHAAVDAARTSNPALVVLGVTVLTSLDENEMGKVGFGGTVREEVLRLAALALDNGCKGIVTSARETAAVRAELGHNFAIVTPGVRPAGASHADQARVATPAEAIAAGASHIVVGRPITEAADPAAEAKAILQQISS